MTKEELKLEYREDPNHQTEDDCPTWEHGYMAARSRHCKCHYPFSMLPVKDMLGHIVKVGDKVIAIAKTTRPGIKIREIKEFTWHRAKLKKVVYNHRRAKVTGLVDSRVGNQILLLVELNCDGCGIEKHRHDMMVVCGDCQI